MKQFQLTRQARGELRRIHTHSLETFGAGRAEKTEQRFRLTFEQLARFPLSGHTRPKLCPPGRSFRFAVVMKLFVVVYESTKAGVLIVRILDGRSDLTSILREG